MACACSRGRTSSTRQVQKKRIPRTKYSVSTSSKAQRLVIRRAAR